MGKDIRIKHDKVNNRFGINEVYRPKYSSLYGCGFQCDMLIRVSPQGVSFIDPYFYFGGAFIPVSERVGTADDLQGYIKALKPIHGLLGKEVIPVKVEGYRRKDGKVTGRIHIIKLLSKKLKVGTQTVGAIERSAPKYLEDMWQSKVEEIFSHTYPSYENEYNKGLSRLDFYRYRLGFMLGDDENG